MNDLDTEGARDLALAILKRAVVDTQRGDDLLDELKRLGVA
jgi:hypothetical protein